MRCIDKTGPLLNAADRDHCLQYCVCVALLYGTLTAEHFSDAVAADNRIDELRRKCAVYESPQYSADYLDHEKRSVANAVQARAQEEGGSGGSGLAAETMRLPRATQVHFEDRSSTPKVEVEFPMGHRQRRAECFSALERKFMAATAARFAPDRAARLYDVCLDPLRFDNMPVRPAGGGAPLPATVVNAVFPPHIVFPLQVPDFLELFRDPPAPFLLPSLRPLLDPAPLPVLALGDAVPDAGGVEEGPLGPGGTAARRPPLGSGGPGSGFVPGGGAAGAVKALRL